MTTIIYAFNAGSSHPLGKIQFYYRIRVLKLEVTCYVIDADTSYNLLLGRPWIHANWIIPSTLHQCFKYMDNNATVWIVFAENQPFKGVENYFTDALLYQEANKVAKEPLLEDDDKGNEVDSEPDEDTPATFAFKPVVAYLNYLECNNPIEDDGEWVINENITFDYPVSVDLFKSSHDTSLHIRLSMLSVTSTPVENGEGSVFVVSSSKRNQSPIVFDRVQPQMSAVTDSGSDSETLQFFHYARSTHHMMRSMGYNLQRGNSLNFRRGRCGLLWTFVPKGKPADYYDKTRKSWDILHHLFNLSLKEVNLSHHIPPVHMSGNQMSVWGLSSKISLLIWLQSVNWSRLRLLKHVILSHRPVNSISSGKSDLNNVNRLLKIRWSRLI